jgi:hypothetical protein
MNINQKDAFVELMINLSAELDNTPDLENRKQILIKIYNSFDCLEGQNFINHPTFRPVFLQKLKEFFKGYPQDFEPLVKKYIPHILNPPLSKDQLKELIVGKQGLVRKQGIIKK